MKRRIHALGLGCSVLAVTSLPFPLESLLRRVVNPRKKGHGNRIHSSGISQNNFYLDRVKRNSENDPALAMYDPVKGAELLVGTTFCESSQVFTARMFS